jgi:pyruvate/2-oxoglutarate dehydrogenase complex dihydrolipoamide acyltransferase (E2) component
MKVLSEITIPKDNADEEVIINDLHYKNNDKVKECDPIMDIETSKTSIELEASKEGFIEYLVSPGDEAVIGQVVAKIYDSDISELLNSNAASLLDEEDNDGSGSKVITKEAQLLIDQHNIDANLIPSDFIKKDDVDSFLASGAIDPSNSTNNANSKTISRLKSLEIKALSSVQSAGLVSTIFINIDIDESLSEEQKKISYLPLIAAQSSQVLEEFPILNSYFSENKIIGNDSINIGIALDIDDGLKVFVLPNTNKLSNERVEGLINEGIYKYLRKELKPDDLSGSTFTISDLSQYGVERFIPLVNIDQGAILGVSSVDLKLNRFNLSLAFDHRVTEGKVASEFLSSLKKRIEQALIK